MEELNKQQEDYILECGMEDYYDFKEQEQRQNDNSEHITKRCKVCNCNDFECDTFVELDVKGSNEWVCLECYNDYCEGEE